MFDILRHFFIPHASNNHRAKALHIDAMFVYVFAFLLFNLVTRTVSTTHPDILGFATNIQVEQLLAETNARRAEAGLSPLSLNQQLSQAAAGKAQDMFTKDYWAHVSPDGKTPWDFIVGAGYKYSVAGENLAKNFQDSSGVVSAWMNSQSHKENLLKSNYKEVGFAIVNGKLQGEETTLVVQMFGTKPSTRVVEAAEPPVIAQNPAPVVAQVVPETVNEEPVITSAPVVVSEVASVSETSPGKQTALSRFNAVMINPLFDITKLRRDVTMVFAGIITGIMLVDIYLAMKRRTVRAVGSTVAHVLFFVGSIISMNLILRGSVL